jgi:hypothetical protein
MPLETEIGTAWGEGVQRTGEGNMEITIRIRIRSQSKSKSTTTAG